MAPLVMIKKTLSFTAVVALASCGPAPTPVAPPASAAPSASATMPAPSASAATAQITLKEAGLDASAIDRSADPCQDFYQFACGGWLARTQIPSDESSWDRTFSEMSVLNEKRLRDILQSAGNTSDDRDVSMGKLADWWASCMDEASVEAAGRKPIDPLLARARRVRDARSLLPVLVELHKARIWALFNISSTQDAKNATQMIAQLDQDGLGLADRDQYLNDDADSKKLREEYQAHVARMLVLTGMKDKQAKRAAGDVLALETSIARMSKTRVQRRDPKGFYNKIDRAGLEKAAPDLRWADYLGGLGFGDIREITVTSIPFVEGMQSLLKTTKPEVWQSYLQWQIAHHTAGMLSKAFVDENFKLEQLLTGQEQQKPRWRRCVASADAGLGEILAQPYVRSFFPGASKASADAIVNAISRAFGEDLKAIDWMAEATRAPAREKLMRMAYQIGFPEKWKSYDFAVDPKAYGANVLAGRSFETRRDLGKVGKATDRTEWFMTPPTVNAYYDSQRNQMTFPAGILQAPFFDQRAAAAVNLGAIGMVMGHELTHGFDDEGAQYDAVGNLKDWWDADTAKRFADKGACVVEQYGVYETLPGLKLNGKLTLGENIADLGGIKLAYAAFRAMRAGSAPIMAEGYSEEQMFFLAHGQAWCTKMQDALARTLVTVDPHSPGRFRVNGPLSNVPAFAQAYRCAPATPMNPSKRCAVW